MAGMDSWNKHAKKVSLRQWVTFREHGQPHFQPTIAKSSISTIAHYWFAAVTCHNWQHNQYPVIQILDTITVLYITNLGDDNSVTKPFASLHETGFLLQLQQRDGHDALPLSGTSSFWYCRDWMLGIPKRNGGNGFLKQTCPTNLVWRCVTFCKHGQLKGWPPRWSSHMGAQSVYCNKSSRPQL